MAKFKMHHAVTKVRSSIRREILDINLHADLKMNLCQNFIRSSTPPSSQEVEEPMGTTFSYLPFAYPASKENHKIVNQLLQFSFRQQRDENISACSGFVSYVISVCLKAIKIECKMESGNLDNNSETSPHMWLIVEDFIIDNCYTKSLTKDKIGYIKKKYPKCYKKAVYVYSSSDLGFKDKEKIQIVKTKKMIDLFKENASKAIILCLNREDLSNYFFTMIRYMWDEFKVDIAGVDPSVRFICWHCGKLPSLSGLFINDVIPDHFDCETLLSDQAVSKPRSETSSGDESWMFDVCGRCKIASYCSHSCQSLDWIDQHKFTCQTRTSVMFLPSDGLD